MISVEEMRALEENSKLSKLQLMENAGIELAKIIEEKYSGKRVLFVCYHGNNGGDGFVAADFLGDKCEVEVCFIGKEEHLKTEALEMFNKLKNNLAVQFIGIEYVNFDDYDCIVDAIIGTGKQGELKPILQSTIKAMNESKGFKISVDVPSGMDPDTGKVDDIAVNADLIITFHDIKKGMSSVKDKVKILDIGISKE